MLIELELNGVKYKEDSYLGMFAFPLKKKKMSFVHSVHTTLKTIMQIISHY